MDITIPCIFCKHFNRDDTEQLSCMAYPNGIPASIQKLEIIHNKPLPNDNGIQYEALNDSQDYFKYFGWINNSDSID